MQFTIFLNLQFLEFMIFGIYDFQNFQFLEFTIFGIFNFRKFDFWSLWFWEFSIFGIFNLWNFQFLEFFIFGISDFGVEKGPLTKCLGKCTDNKKVFLGPREHYSRSKNHLLLFCTPSNVYVHEFIQGDHKSITPFSIFSLCNHSQYMWTYDREGGVFQMSTQVHKPQY